jgi:Pyruvate/2-oxoacid:ferredoxin oxidoreductase delta subunit
MSVPLPRLKNWMNELNICIRCGYCYELCHLYKSGTFETDTPRGKLLLIYGLLTGALEPDGDMVEKIVQCFHCKNCERSCSGKVSITEIITDAKADFLEAGYDFRGLTARTDDDLCSRCRICQAICNNEAISFDEEGKKIDPVKCEGCGVCASTCPSNAIIMVEGFGVTRRELGETVRALLEEV